MVAPWSTDLIMEKVEACRLVPRLTKVQERMFGIWICLEDRAWDLLEEWMGLVKGGIEMTPRLKSEL